MNQKTKSLKSIKVTILAIFALFYVSGLSQNTSQSIQKKSPFWEKVQFGGGLGLSFTAGNTNISVSPSAIYNVSNEYSVGAGIQYTYLKQQNVYKSNMIGVSIINLYSPIENLQLSGELEQTRVMINSLDPSLSYGNFWNTALFIGAGYRVGNFTTGLRYNILNNSNLNKLYTTGFTPFVRVFF
jgi:hypothetical protein